MTDLALAALRVWAVEVELAGRMWRIEPTPAAGWFSAILSGETAGVIPGMCELADEEDFLDLMVAGTIRWPDVQRANRDALAAASGWKWWEAERMIHSMAAEWRLIGGLLTSHGVNLERQSLGAVLNATYSLAVRNMSKDDKFVFDSQLSRPPLGAAPASEWFDEAEFADAFVAAEAEAFGRLAAPKL